MPGVEANLSSGIKSSPAGPEAIKNAGKSDERITRKAKPEPQMLPLSGAGTTRNAGKSDERITRKKQKHGYKCYLCNRENCEMTVFYLGLV